MRCANCQAGHHGHHGQCQAPVYERVGNMGTEIIGLCQCINDSQVIIADRAEKIAKLRQAIDESLVECVGFAMTDTDGHVNCVDDELDTHVLAETMFDRLADANWMVPGAGQ